MLNAVPQTRFIKDTFKSIKEYTNILGILDITAISFAIIPDFVWFQLDGQKVLNHDKGSMLCETNNNINKDYCFDRYAPIFHNTITMIYMTLAIFITAIYLILMSYLSDKKFDSCKLCAFMFKPLHQHNTRKIDKINKKLKTQNSDTNQAKLNLNKITIHNNKNNTLDIENQREKHSDTGTIIHRPDRVHMTPSDHLTDMLKTPSPNNVNPLVVDRNY